MPKIDIYTTMLCPYCHRAKALLKSKNVDFDEIDVSMNAGERKKMRDRAGGANTVPQIFIDEQHIGGCDDLLQLEEAGGLDPLLSAV